jgi:3-mercaptopyruvate sulfurtransferase SseA
VVYYSDETCIASRIAYQMMTEGGYTHVRRYAGGLADWEAAGYPLEGKMA